MTQRDRHTPEAGDWEELFHAIAPDRRQQLLELAGRQGVLYAHQLPPADHGPARRPLLSALLNGQTHELRPLRPAAVECGDACLDEAQREAVARALDTPDVCLIQGRPGAGKSRVAAEVVGLAAARGERVLLLAPTAPAVDCVLERLDGRAGVCPTRCLAPGERPESLPPGLRRLLPAERLRSVREEAVPAARRAAAEARDRLERRRRDVGAWPLLEDQARRWEAAADEARRLADAIAGAEAEVEAEAAAADGPSPFQREEAALRAARDQALARIDARLAQLRAEAAKVRGEREAAAGEAARLRPLADARRGGRWWTGAWWRARREGDLAGRLDALDARQAELTAAGDKLAGETEERAAERAHTEAGCQEASARRRQRELARRREEREERRDALLREQRTLEEEAAAVRGRLSEGMDAPAGPSPAAVAQARDAWRRLLEQDERRAELTAQWADALETALPSMPERMAGSFNVVGAVAPALAADPHFGDHASPAVTFDLLVLEEAHLVTESDFLAAARRARRWVLIGEPADDAPPHPGRRPSGHGRGGAPPGAPRPGFFQRLWRRLHPDPRRLPYAWFHREGRLVCRLHAAAPGEERWVASEHLADRPEIELRIAAPPRKAPELLEVLFPAPTPIHEAKQFIFRELGELTVEARGGAFRWRGDAGKVVLDLSDGAEPDATVVELADGARERVGRAPPAGDGGVGWQTCSLEFDAAAGWTRELAGQWVEERLQTRDLGRTALLEAPHRFRPSLARFVCGLLYEGAAAPVPETDGPRPVDDAAVEFVPVPAPDEERVAPPPPSRAGNGIRRGGAAVAPRPRPAPGGAGFEINLADPCRPDPLPPDVRAALPRQGLVNLFEARAVVRKLEALAADPGFRTAAAEWARRGGDAACASPSCRAAAVSCVGRRPALAVMALYPAQVQLIRLLASQSPALAAAPVAVEIAAPEAFRQRECFTALVGLTRSHSHRAVAFGGDPSLLPTALTRAAHRLILFGDPGTLVRRCQWNGAVDHLDDAAGERERAWIARLVACLHGGPQPSTSGIDEGGRA